LERVLKELLFLITVSSPLVLRRSRARIDGARTGRTSQRANSGSEIMVGAEFPFLNAQGKRAFLDGPTSKSLPAADFKNRG
jgi:hypothetical protein